MRAPDPRFFRLKAAMADLVARCGGQKRAGEMIGVSQQMVSNICHRENGAMLSLAGKLALEQECGSPVVTAVEAELLGYRLARVEPATVEPGCAHSAHAAIMREVGDLCLTVGQAVADGKYSRTDAVTVGRELAELRRAIESFERVNAATLASEGA